MKLLPPLTLSDDELTEGLAVIDESIKSVLR
jgi:diaminobutyrate-2-oxoglutarate transaminase